MSRQKGLFHTIGDKLPVIMDYMASNSINNHNHRLFTYYSNLALNRFRWSNLPEGLTSEIIEKQLFMNGMVGFTNDKEYGLISLPAHATGFNIYNEPNQIELIGNSYNKTLTLNDNLDKTEAILLKENDLRYPPVLHLMHYINLNDEVEKTVKMNLGQQRFPVIIPKTTTTELSIKDFSSNIFNEYFPIQMIDKRMEKALGGDLEKVQALNTGVPFLLNDLQDFKHDIENELYTYLGLNNANTDKKERLIVDEVNSNNNMIEMSLDISFKNREQACKLINEKYNLNIKVEKVKFTLDDEELKNKGVEEDGPKPLHSGT